MKLDGVEGKSGYAVLAAAVLGGFGGLILGMPSLRFRAQGIA